MKILIADDDPVPRRLLEVSLAKWGYEVVVARDGAEAWQALERDDAPKLAILDWLMPGMDGVEVCRKVRERADAPYVFILLLTSKDRKEDLVAGMEAGADDYLVKPFDPHELQVRVRAGRRILDLEAALRASLEEVERAHQREGQIGAKIQQTLLLGQPPQQLPGIRVTALTIPSQQVDGDFYDFLTHSAQCLDIVVGDVMGKGVPAALMGAAIKSHFVRALSHLSTSAPGTLPEPEAIVMWVHAEVTGQFIGLERFATLCYARFDLHRRRIVFVDCGHTKTIHFRHRTGTCALLEGESMPLGFSERETYRQVAVPFEAGDLFFFYSDGVTEAEDAAGELFGVERLVEFIRTRGRLEPEELIEEVRRAVVAFSSSETFADDLTCVAVRIEDTKRAPLVAHAEREFPSDLAQLAPIGAFLRDFCRGAPSPALDEDSLSQIELAVTEAASNIMKHAYHGRTDGRIWVEADLFAESVSVRLSHLGEAFDPAAVKPPAFDGSREGGFGVYIIAQSVDEVHYFGDAQGRNCVHLVKSRENRREGNRHGNGH